MLANYLKSTVRNFRASKISSLISVFGLAVGIASIFLSILYVKAEFTADHQHPYIDRTYKVIRETRVSGRSPSFSSGKTSGALASSLQRDFPEVEKTVLVVVLNVA